MKESDTSAHTPMMHRRVLPVFS